MTTQQEFKQTEIGKIPKEWEVVRLGEVLTLKNGERPLATDNGIFPIYGANGIMGHISNFLVNNHFTIVIGRVGASGEIDLGTGKIWISDNAIYSENYDSGKVYMPFLYYLLKSKELSQFASKTTHPIITQSFLNLFLISLPPLPEQKKIAEILSAVDKAIERVDESIGKTERLKKGLMQELLTKGIGHKEFKDTEIGRIPKEWEVVRVEDIVTKFVSGGTPSTKEPTYWNGEVPWLTSAYIDGFYVSSGEKYISKSGLENSATNIVPKDNILIATRVGIGKIAINLIDIAISQDLTGAVIRKEKVYSNFLCWSFLSPKVQGALQSFVRGTTIKGIARSELVKIRLPLPPLPEQKKIAEILSTVDKRLELLRKKKEKLERVKKGLMDDLLSGRRRVETKS